MIDLLRTVLATAIQEVQHLIWAAFSTLVGRDRLQRVVDANGIVMFVGPNGSGKSLAAVDSMLPTLDGIEWECDDLEHVHNRPVREHARACEGCVRVTTPARRRWWHLRMRGASSAWSWCEVGAALHERYGRGVRYAYSTLPLIDPATGEEHELYRPLRDYRQLVGIEHAEVLFDEVAGVSDAQDSASTPAALVRWVQQLRKRDVRLRITSPAFKRASLPLRQVCTLVVDCRSYFPEESESGRLWRPRRAMLWEAYDGFAFSEFEKTTGERIKREARRYYWRLTGRAQHSYSTLAQVHALAEVTDAGMCMACGGSRSKPKCACQPGTEDLAYGALRIVEKVAPSGGRVRHAVAAEVQ